MEQTKVVTTPGPGSINWKDIAKGLLVAVITPVFTIALQSVNDGSLTFDWKAIGLTALSAGLAYLSKNFFSPSQDIIKTEKVDE